MAKLLWKAIIEKYASSQASNRARIFNDFFYIRFKPDKIEEFITRIKVCLKKMLEVGITLPNNLLAYLILFKFPKNMKDFKRKIMHTDKELLVKYVLNHLTQLNKKSKAQGSQDIPNNQSGIALMNTKSLASNTHNGERQRCMEGWQNPKQDKLHTANNYWHLHPELAPDWWREDQTKWKA